MNPGIAAAHSRLLLMTLLSATSAFASEGRLDEIVVHSPGLEGNMLRDSPERDG